MNGENGHKSLADYAANKNAGADCTAVAAKGKYPVCDENYGYNLLRCSDEVGDSLTSCLHWHLVIDDDVLCEEISRCQDCRYWIIADICLCSSGVESQS